MTNNTNWTQNLGLNFRAMAKAAAGFYQQERDKAPGSPEAPLR